MIPRLPNDPAPAPAPDSSSPDRPRRIAAPALAGLAALVLAGCGGGDGSAEAPQAQALAARAATAATTATTATAAGTQRYIVVLRSHVTDPRTRSTDLMRGRGGEVRHVYGARGRGLRGFAVTVPDGGAESFLAALERHPDVDLQSFHRSAAARLVRPSRPRRTNHVFDYFLKKPRRVVGARWKCSAVRLSTESDALLTGCISTGIYRIYIGASPLMRKTVTVNAWKTRISVTVNA